MLQKMWRRIYGQEVELVIEVNDTVFANVSCVLWDLKHFICLSFDSQAMQRVYEWRGSFGSSAICIVNAFFSSDVHEGALDSDEQRVSFSKSMLENLRFMYSTADGDDPLVGDYPDSDKLLIPV